MPSNHLIPCWPLLLPSILPSIRVFSNESVLHIRWPKYWSFSISNSNEYSGLISFRMDWLDLLALQGTLKSLLQHHSSKTSVPWCSAFFTVQLSHPYMTTRETIALTSFFLPRSKGLLISWLTVWITTKCGKFFKRWEYQTTLPASWEIYMQVKKQQLESDMGQGTDSKLGKEYIKAIYCHPAYLTSM